MMNDTMKTCLFLDQSTSTLTVTEAINSVIVSIISCITSVTATFGNALGLYAFYKYRRLRSLSNILLMSLCVTDLLTGAVVQPLFAVRRLYELDSRSNICIIRLVYIFFANLCAGASMLTLGLVTLDRFAAITSPYRYLSIACQRLYIIIITSVWFLWAMFVLLPFINALSMTQYFTGITTVFISILVTVIVCYGMIYRVIIYQRRKIAVVPSLAPTAHSDRQIPENTDVSDNKDSVVKAYIQQTRKATQNQATKQLQNSGCQLLSVAHAFAISKTFGSTSPSGIRTEQAGVSIELTSMQNSDQTSSSKNMRNKNVRIYRGFKKEQKQAKTIAIIIMTLLLCYLPQIALLVVRAINGDNRHLLLIDAWVDLLVYLNSSMNPLIYCIRNSEIRRCLKCIFKMK